MHILRQTRFHAADLVGETLVVAHGKPVFLTIGCARFQQKMEVLNHSFRQLFGGVVNDVVDALEVVDRFYNIVYPDYLIGCSEGVGFEDVACLFVCQATTFDVV